MRRDLPVLRSSHAENDTENASSCLRVTNHRLAATVGEPSLWVISAWNTSAVISMLGMFDDAQLFNANISSWDTANTGDDKER